MKAMKQSWMLIWGLIFLGILPLQAQNNPREYGKNIVKVLTSEKFAGRGYVDNGMNKAADYIAQEFQKLGINPINGTYFQEFSMPINIIKNAELSLNGNRLKYGIDFIVKPNSKSQNFQQKEIYYFDPIAYANALPNEKDFIAFIQNDFDAQINKHIVFPPHKFDIDSLNQYYKHWPNFYKSEENKDRAIFFFTKDKLTASLSQSQEGIAQFFIQEKYYSHPLQIDNYRIESEFNPEFKARNVVGMIEGKNKDSIIVITAHYDHLGKVGETIFPGANDNASGTAFLLSLAKHYAKKQPNYTLVFIAFAAEEAGLIGSYHFAENPMVDLRKIKFLLNFDIMGAGEEGIQIVNSSIFTKEYELLNQINSKKNYVKQIKKRGESCNSDHCPFYKKGVPSFFTYTLGGKGYYHDPFDTGNSIDLQEFNPLQKLFIEFIDSLN